MHDPRSLHRNFSRLSADRLMTATTASQLVVDAKLLQFHEEIYQGQEEAAMPECNGQTSSIN